MGTPLVISFDIGTQSARCILVRPDGSFVDMCRVKYEEPYFSKNPGWAEQKPDFYYEQICMAGKTVCERNKDKMGDVIAVTLTVIRDTVMCLDKDNKPLRDIILWLDKRQADYNKAFAFYKNLMFSLVGMGETTKIIYKATACNWIKQNEKEIWDKTAKFVLLPTYLNYKMTGNLVDSEANMVGHIPFDSKRRTWCSKHDLTRCIRDVPNEKLCKLVKSGVEIGKITKKFSQDSGVPEGLPLISTGSDKGCETLGLSVFHENQASISLGTTATLEFSMRKYVEPQKFMPAYPAIINDMYNPEIEIYRGLWLVSWFIKEFAKAEVEEAKLLGISTEELLNDRIRSLSPCCEGLLLQPYWTPGIVNPTSKGAIIGFGDFHTRYHLYRAIIEGLGFELYTSLRIMEKRAKLKIEEVFIGGGGASSDVICQIMADIMGLPVKRIQTSEAATIGASMVAFVAEGVFKDYEDASRNMVKVRDTFCPNPKNHNIYMEYYNSAYSRIFGKLEPIYKKIIKIMNSQETRS